MVNEKQETQINTQMNKMSIDTTKSTNSKFDHLQDVDLPFAYDHSPDSTVYGTSTGFQTPKTPASAMTRSSTLNTSSERSTKVPNSPTDQMIPKPPIGHSPPHWHKPRTMDSQLVFAKPHNWVKEETATRNNSLSDSTGTLNNEVPNPFINDNDEDDGHFHTESPKNISNNNSDDEHDDESKVNAEANDGQIDHNQRIFIQNSNQFNLIRPLTKITPDVPPPTPVLDAMEMPGADYSDFVQFSTHKKLRQLLIQQQQFFDSLEPGTAVVPFGHTTKIHKVVVAPTDIFPVIDIPATKKAAQDLINSYQVHEVNKTDTNGEQGQKEDTSSIPAPSKCEYTIKSGSSELKRNPRYVDLTELTKLEIKFLEGQGSEMIQPSEQ